MLAISNFIKCICFFVFLLIIPMMSFSQDDINRCIRVLKESPSWHQSIVDCDSKMVIFKNYGIPQKNSLLYNWRNLSMQPDITMFYEDIIDIRWELHKRNDGVYRDEYNFDRDAEVVIVTWDASRSYPGSGERVREIVVGTAVPKDAIKCLIIANKKN